MTAVMHALDAYGTYFDTAVELVKLGADMNAETKVAYASRGQPE
jgi:hypothetical protein